MLSNHRQRIGGKTEVDLRRRRIGMVARRAAAHDLAQHQQQDVIDTPQNTAMAI